jgi:hypothetical protein
VPTRVQKPTPPYGENALTPNRYLVGWASHKSGTRGGQRVFRSFPDEAGAVPDWDGLPYSTKSLGRCRLLVSFNGLRLRRRLGTHQPFIDLGPRAE